MSNIYTDAVLKKTNAIFHFSEIHLKKNHLIPFFKLSVPRTMWLKTKTILEC